MSLTWHYTSDEGLSSLVAHMCRSASGGIRERACLLDLDSTACRERPSCDSCDSTGAICVRVRARALRPSLRRRFFRLLVRLLWEPRSRWRLRCRLCPARSFRLAASESAATAGAAAASAAAIAPLINSCTTSASV